MIRLRHMTAADVPFGMELKAQAGWNQTEADWQRCLALEPDGCFVAEWNGTPAGTTTTCVFGPVAWVAMVLVRPELRGRGIGKALMEHALAYLDEQGIETIRLDATALGQPLYEKLGFIAQFTLDRFEGILPDHAPVGAVRPGRSADMGNLLDLDRKTTATDRIKLLEGLISEAPAELRLLERSGQIAGFILTRQGSNALQIGPCIADQTAGPLLLADVCSRHAARRVYVDVPATNHGAIRTVRGLGLTVQRPLTRMSWGVLIQENLETLWASSGPEKG
jgi:ribosomal protein S18 acetylase RimI-like enzyme